MYWTALRGTLIVCNTVFGWMLDCSFCSMRWTADLAIRLLMPEMLGITIMDARESARGLSHVGGPCSRYCL